MNPATVQEEEPSDDEDTPRLSAKAQVYWALQKRMFADLAKEDKDSKELAFNTAWKLLLHGDLPIPIRAGCYMVLSCQRDGFGIGRAQKAIELLEGLGDGCPQKWMNEAKRLLKVAQDKFEDDKAAVNKAVDDALHGDSEEEDGEDIDEGEGPLAAGDNDINMSDEQSGAGIPDSPSRVQPSGDMGTAENAADKVS